MSQASQPSIFISVRLIGRNGAGLSGCARWRAQENRGLSAWMAVCMGSGIGLRRRKYNRPVCRPYQGRLPADADQIARPFAPFVVESRRKFPRRLRREKLADRRRLNLIDWGDFGVAE